MCKWFFREGASRRRRRRREEGAGRRRGSRKAPTSGGVHETREHDLYHRFGLVLRQVTHSLNSDCPWGVAASLAMWFNDARDNDLETISTWPWEQVGSGCHARETGVSVTPTASVPSSHLFLLLFIFWVGPCFGDWRYKDKWESTRAFSMAWKW